MCCTFGTRCRMQMQDAECRSGPKATAVRDVQDAGCRMQNAKTHPQPGESEQSTMQDAGAECKNSPNIGRRGQKKSRTECTMQVQNTESHPRVHCVCREGLYGADALYTDCVLHATCLLKIHSKGGTRFFIRVRGPRVHSWRRNRRRLAPGWFHCG